METEPIYSEGRTGAAARVCAVIVSHNSGSAILRTIDAILPQVTAVFVVDNGSDAKSRCHLQRVAADAKVVLHADPINHGIAAALNRGVEYARRNQFEWLLSMDQDSIAAPRMVETLLACRALHYVSDPTVVSLSPAIIDAAYQGTARSARQRECHEARLVVITSGHLVKVSAYDRVGLYDERLFIDSVDFDFCLRLRAAGLKTIRCHDAKLYHSLGTKKRIAFGRREFTITVHSPTRRYYITRNHIYVTSKYLSQFPLWCIRKHLGMLVLIFQILLLETDKLENLRQVFRGFIAGVRATVRNQW